MSNYDKSHQGSLGTGSVNPRHPKNVDGAALEPPAPPAAHPGTRDGSQPPAGSAGLGLDLDLGQDRAFSQTLSGEFCASSVCLSCPERSCRTGTRGNPPRARGCSSLPRALLPQKTALPSSHKTRGIPSAEISGNFTRTPITPVCRAQHCLEREQQAFPLEASFLFGAVYGRGAVSHCGTNTLSAFALEDGHSIPLSAAKTRRPAPAPSTVIF